ncbi:hypothetical protein EVAR_33818_1 [Eumeta japonica]|uniref:Uncharacterized protein n=1 Tax=Eumeta variegata TaxID=151549 RepID=A0A4C1VAC0_EUMVA|nr:hypothetical protein EVAR_33818_1 [Eumeta japonica]
METLRHASTKEKTCSVTLPKNCPINKLASVLLYTLFIVLQCKCETVVGRDKSSTGKPTDQCHSCDTNSFNSVDNSNVKDANDDNREGVIDDLITSVGELTIEYLRSNKTNEELEVELENMLGEALNKDRYEIIEGVAIEAIDENEIKKIKRSSDASNEVEGRALFSKYTYEYRLLQKVKDFIENHILSINLPKAAKAIGYRSFGLKKFFLPLLIGAQIFKSILLAMFLPSILGSFGKILGKGLSQLSASSSQASYPPMNAEDVDAYSQNKDVMGYESDPAGGLAYPGEGQYDMMDQTAETSNDVTRYGFGGQRVTYLPTKNGYYRNQLTSASNNYKVFQKIPSSSMILSNYDPFYSPLLSRLDGIFARLGLAPSENSIDDGMQIGGQSISEIKLESCREQLICLMYASPAKYAPYSNLVSAQLSRELNELRRPVSDNPEILRFFRYMRAARRGQEGVDCVRAHPACSDTAAPAPAHTMIAAYHDINKLVMARKLTN